MKTLTTVLLASVAFAVASPAFAGRDEVQMMQHWKAVKAKQAEALAKANQERTGLAGPTGVAGKPGPGTAPKQVTRVPGSHP